MRARLACAVALLAACESAPVDSTAALLADGTRYLDDAAFRRAELERSLTNPDNSYSRQRLASYGLETHGWDRLPEWNPRSRALDGDDALALEQRGLAGLEGRAAPAPLWDGVRPTTLEAWVALGRQVFFGYPMRPEPLAELAIARPVLAAEVGLERLPDGSYPGWRVIVDTDGRTRVGMTCAACHTAVEGGQLVVGRARRSFDYGKLRTAYHAITGEPVDPALLARMAHWGPGRADVTEDDEDPVAIPDLWGVSAQPALNQAGTIKQRAGSPVALAIRQETQLLHANHQRVRPPRELALALALFVRSLEPPPRPVAHTAETARGAHLFAQTCVRCHDNAAYGGDPVAADEIGTDGALANGLARGTGRYRPPALLDVARAAPYLHHGAVPTLDDLLSTERLSPAYDRSPTGPGAVPGHLYGTTLDAADRAALVAFLGTL